MSKKIGKKKSSIENKNIETKKHSIETETQTRNINIKPFIEAKILQEMDYMEEKLDKTLGAGSSKS